MRKRKQKQRLAALLCLTLIGSMGLPSMAMPGAGKSAAAKEGRLASASESTSTGSSAKRKAEAQAESGSYANLASASVAVRQGDDGIEYVTGGETFLLDGDTLTVTTNKETTENRLTIASDVEAMTVILEDVSIAPKEEQSAIDVRSGQEISFVLEGENELQATNDKKAVFHVAEDARVSFAGDGSLSVINGSEDALCGGSGIGSDYKENGGSITIESGEIDVKIYGEAIGIGGAMNAEGGEVIITGGTVSASVDGMERSAGTAIGSYEEIGLIDISGGTVNASVRTDNNWSYDGAAIGSATYKGGDIRITGGSVYAHVRGDGAAIGGGTKMWVTGGTGHGPELDPAKIPLSIYIGGSAEVNAVTESVLYSEAEGYFYAGAAIGSGVQDLQDVKIEIVGNAVVNAEGSWYGAGIGGSYVQEAEYAHPMEIHIGENAEVTASSEFYGAGIGQGSHSYNGDNHNTVLIDGNAVVRASGGQGGAGIGGANGSDGGTIQIKGNAEVYAIGDAAEVEGYELWGGAGIGGGSGSRNGSRSGNIEISENAQVTAVGGEFSAAIGGGSPSDGGYTGKVENNPGSVNEIRITGEAEVIAVGGKEASAIGGSADMPDAIGSGKDFIPEGGTIVIGPDAVIEAYADGAKFAIDRKVDLDGVQNKLVNGRFAAGEVDCEDGETYTIGYVNGDRDFVLPSSFRSFAASVSADGDYEIEDRADGRLAYYTKSEQDPVPADDQEKNFVYSLKDNTPLHKDNLRWAGEVPYNVVYSYAEIVNGKKEVVETIVETKYGMEGKYAKLPDTVSPHAGFEEYQYIRDYSVVSSRAPLQKNVPESLVAYFLRDSEEAQIAAYRLEYYYQQADGSYALKKTETRYKEANAEVSANTDDMTPEDAAHYRYNAEKSVQAGTVAADGSTVLKLFFDRKEAEPEKPDHGHGGGSGSGSGSGGSVSRGAGYTVGVDGHWVHMDPDDFNIPISEMVPEGATPVSSPKWHTWKFYLNSGSVIHDRWAYIKNPYAVDDQPREGWFAFDENGVMQYGWYLDEASGKWYYLHRESDGMLGTMETGWHYDDQDGRWYYLDQNGGAMLLGWQQIDGKWYYFNPYAPSVTWDFVEETGGWTFNGSVSRPYGSMYTDETTPDGYQVGEDGAWIK